MKTAVMEYQEDMPLARYTTWRVGGNAKIFFQPKDREELAQFLSSRTAEEKFFWLGLGSNLLIRDGGITETVINTFGGLDELKHIAPTEVFVEAGAGCAQVARFTARLGLEGAEFLAGIPGTMGGALAMNAGCFGAETWQIVKEVETINRRGEIHKRRPDDFAIAYREVTSPREEWFLSCTLSLQEGDKSKALEKIKTLLDHRAKTQPTGDHSCGSVFRNPPGDFAGRLIEDSGLKGFRLGGAQVSEKHANFIINENSASAKDIEELIAHVQKTVAEKFGVELVREVKIVGREK